MNRERGQLLYFFTIGCSSVLLFSVQPVMAKAILPKFGGSAGVWVASILFFQVVLVMGYLYSYWATGHLNRKAQSGVHLALLILSLCVLPVKPRLEWALSGTQSPSLSIFSVLLVSVGLPYFLLSTTTPLLQSWFATSYAAVFPYRLFALSNAASVLALLAYPALIEPLLPVSEQLHWWSVGYAVLVLLACMTAILQGSRNPVEERVDAGESENRPFLWIGLAACASTLWLATANHLGQEVAPVPFLWVLPLSVYLFTFIVCFGEPGWYRVSLFRWLLPAAWIAGCYNLARQGSAGGLQWEISGVSLALFIWCMFCHGEIARTKPQRQRELTFFYLMIALGGALGGVFVGFVAPNVFSTYLELPIGITACVLLALPLLYGLKSPKRLARLGVVALATFIVAARFHAGSGDVVHLRNFYGALQVNDTGTGEMAFRTLYNGRTLHGVEFLSPARSRLATAYYGPESGVGRTLLSSRRNGRRVGVVGLGVGTLATYGRSGDSFRFYEINPAVIQVASRHFRFLDGSEARTDVVAGDGRLALEHESSNSFDVIVLDAFSDDSIPVHLMTKEAFGIYFRLLRNDGILAIHLTNRYVNLEPLVNALAGALQKHVVQVHNPADPERQILAADWALVSGQEDVLKGFSGSTNPGAKARTVRLWTDDYSNLFQVLK